MTGKFTQHVHNLGHYLGRSLHTTIRWTVALYHQANDNSVTIRSVDPVTNATKLKWLSKQLCALGSSSCHAPPVATTAATSSSSPATISYALRTLATTLSSLPSQYKTWWLNLLHSDPLHVLIETLLIAFCIALVILQRRADWRLDRERKNQTLHDDEVEELLLEWKTARMPLGGGDRRSAPPADEPIDSNKRPIVDRIQGSKLFLHPDSDPTSVVNFATHDYLSASSSPALRAAALSALRTYGCGSCGPRGFYGTIDAHLELESDAARFLGTEGAVLYSDGASAATSTVAAFAKRGDLLVVDEGVNEALVVGVMLSRANVRYFRHNDVADLRRVLEKVRGQDEALGRRPTDQRRFLVVEGLYKNWGTVCPLNEVVALKEEFCYRLILDDSHAMGTMGETGRGSLERCGLLPMVHCEILTFSIENSFGSVGGITVGSEEVVDHQRLSGAGYCFSASAPPFLSKVCVASLKRLQGTLDEVPSELGQHGENSQSGVSDVSKEELSGPPLLNKLRENISNLYNTLTDSTHPHALKLRNRLVITSHPQSSIIYLRLSDQQATGLTRAEQTSLLDRIATHCLAEGGVAVVSTGGHVKKYLQLVPEPCLRVVANVSQTMEDVEALVKGLGEAVEEVLCRNVFGLEIIKED